MSQIAAARIFGFAHAGILVFLFLATDDEMAEEAGDSPEEVAQFSAGVSSTWQGT